MDLDDLDAALDGLSQPPASPLAEGEVSNLSEASMPPPLTPPPMRQRKSSASALNDELPSTWHGRTTFDELFVPDVAAAPLARGGPDEKVEYFREKLKRAEAQGSRFREAWQVREREIDGLENLYRGQADQIADKDNALAELNGRLQAIEQFVEQKKQEYEAYGQRVAQTFSQKDEEQAALRAQMARLEEAHALQMRQKQEELEGVHGQIHEIQDALSLEQRQRRDDVAGLSAELHDSRSQHSQTQEQLDYARKETEASQEEQRQSREAFERELAVNNEAIENLKARLDKQREAMLEREASIDRLTSELAELNEGALQKQTELETLLAQLSQDLEAERASHDEDNSRHYTALTAREQEIGIRDNSIHELNQELEATRQNLEQRESELAQLQSLSHDQQREMQDAMAHRDEANAKLKATLEAQRAQNEELEGQVEHMQAQLTHSQERVRAVQARQAELIGRTRRALEMAHQILGN